MKDDNPLTKPCKSHEPTGEELAKWKKVFEDARYDPSFKYMILSSGDGIKISRETYETLQQKKSIL